MPKPTEIPSVLVKAAVTKNEELMASAEQIDVKIPKTIQKRKKRVLGILLRKTEPPMAEITSDKG
jgi:hypothetical protein